MKFDKFGMLALVIGLVVLFATLHFGFFGGNIAGWTADNLIKAVITTILGGLVLLGLFGIAIGLLLLLL